MKIPVSSRFFCLFCTMASAIALSMVYFFVPTERTMGIVQKIFYLHVPSAWIALLASGVICISSLAYLLTGAHSWNIAAHASAEIGVIFSATALISGALWAKPVWNVWWAFDTRLLMTIVLLLTFAGYILLRNRLKPHYMAAYGIIVFLDVPCIYCSIRWWRTLHPAPIISLQTGIGMTTDMLITLLVCVAAFFSLSVYCFHQRLILTQMEKDVEVLRSEVEHVVAKRHVPQGFLVENQNFIIEEYHIEERSRG